ncbi:Squalene/phytoene synthase-domain-containing protein [Fusarium tricinctum]|uniref:Bifunctional lycopene cyclase/phytoene synthase n=1 Tax=Fusarium tricinctum TaxID=61284 RepID=A0A8K0RZA3_9HYPO|nr:Squalene/phytoene synthase-domain-containing protein [Fusarium tricinctum]
MGWEYAQVHLKYTIPLGIILGAVYRPLLSRLDVFKLVFMITTAVVSTIPWDSYLIRNRIWTYPPGVVIGLTAWDIPAEELFFFVIQTLNTSLLYMLLSKPTFHPIYLGKKTTWGKIAGQVLFASAIIFGAVSVSHGGEGMYLGLILIWACPFLLFLWTISYQFIVNLPWTNTALPIALPTLYLWVVDTFALRRGTWSISSGTKYGFVLWDGLDIEEAVFFLLTNTLIVFGLVACDNTLAILDTFPEHFPRTKGLPNLIVIIKALLLPEEKYDQERISGLVSAVDLLRKKSRSFYLASGTFEGRLRIDLIRLYAFCRAADDLVDEAASLDESRTYIEKLRKFLDLAYEENEEEITPRLRKYVTSNFPEIFHMALLQLPTFYLPKQPLDDLLKGFDTDLLFDKKSGGFPIENTDDLDVYGSRVAGTVAELCNHLILYHTPETLSEDTQRDVVACGQEMGIALQYVNIARDIKTDADIDRVYLPLEWLKEAQLTPQDVIKQPYGPTIENLRQKLLDRAFEKYNMAKSAIDKLPSEGKGPIRVAVESYMEIGRVLRETGPVLKKGRATVPKMRRIRVAWSALNK